MSQKAAARRAGHNTTPVIRSIPRVIAVDGSAASGKSTIGRELAARLGYPFLDTGIMYRAITLAALRSGVPIDDADAISRLAGTTRLDVALPSAASRGDCSVLIDGIDVSAELRGPEVEDAVSLVSRVPGVREALVQRQQEIAGVQAMVMAGRDIGTVVLPQADLKIYLDASPEERARRRHREFAASGRAVTRRLVASDLQRRDQIDRQRSVSPLTPAHDAVIIDTDGLSQEEVLRAVLKLVGLPQ